MPGDFNFITVQTQLLLGVDKGSKILQDHKLTLTDACEWVACMCICFVSFKTLLKTDDYGHGLKHTHTHTLVLFSSFFPFASLWVAS